MEFDPPVETGSFRSRVIPGELIWLTIAIAVYFIFVFLTSDVRSAFAVGGDDGIELAKSLLLERTPQRLSGMWNDQPWLHTIITGHLFSALGEFPWVPRIISTLSMFCLLLALSVYYRSELSFPSLVGLSILLLTSDELNYMMFSGMTEVPAIATATIAALCCAIGAKRRAVIWVIGAGVLYSAALQIKLTALILCPSIAFCCLNGNLRESLKSLVTFSVSTVVGFAAIAMISPAFNWQQIWSTHTDARNIVSSVGTGQIFRWVYILQNPALFLAATLGIVALMRHRQWMTLGMPGLFLLGACAFAILQRPWWKFYLVQLNIPLGILGAFGFESLLKGNRLANPSAFPSRAWRHSALLLILCCWCGFAVPAFLKSVEFTLYSRHKFEEARIVRAAKVYHEKEGISWCYAADPALVFASGMLVPPSLTVVSQKRMLVTGLDNKGIAEEAKRLDVPMLILRSDGEADRIEWASWVTNNYEFVLQGSANELWVKRGLKLVDEHPIAKPQPDVRLKFVQF